MTEDVGDIDLASALDDVLLKLTHRGLRNSGDSYEVQYNFDMLLSFIADAPNAMWSPERVTATLSVLHDFASELESENRAWSIYSLLGGRAPPRLLKAHLKGLEETFDLAVLQKTYYHFVHHGALLRDIVDWRGGKKQKLKDPSSWKAGLMPNHHDIDWSKSVDPVATLLTLRAAWPYADEDVKRVRWEAMLENEKRTQWNGSLRHSTLVAALEDSHFLSCDILDKYLDKCLVDLDFIERLPDTENNIDIYDKPRALGKMQDFWLQLRLRRLDLVAPVEGGDIAVRQQKRKLIEGYNRALKTNKNPDSLTTFLSLALKHDPTLVEKLNEGLSAAWSYLLETCVTSKEKNLLELVYDDVSDLAVARHYIENLCVKTLAQHEGLPEDIAVDIY